MEGADNVHIWLSRLDELPRSTRSAQADEGSMRDYKGSSGFFLTLILNSQKVDFILVVYSQLKFAQKKKTIWTWLV